MFILCMFIIYVLVIGKHCKNINTYIYIECSILIHLIQDFKGSYLYYFKEKIIQLYSWKMNNDIKINKHIKCSSLLLLI